MATAASTPAPARYGFDNSTADAAVQTELLGRILDSHTEAVIRHTTKGVLGARCLDLGAGAGSITHLLADEAGPAGHVVALDIDPCRIQPHERIEIRTGDIRTAELGDSEYDLIHARLVLMHIPDDEREAVLHRIVAALRPGGTLILSDWDCTRLEEIFVHGPDDVRDAFNAFQRTLIGILEGRGMSAGWARRAPAAMIGAGLEQVRSQVFNMLWAGGEPGLLLHASNSRQLERQLLDAGMTLDQLQVLRDGMKDPSVQAFSYLMYSTVGVRPR
jgi:SAM-dependent methyltransferase